MTRHLKATYIPLSSCTYGASACCRFLSSRPFGCKVQAWRDVLYSNQQPLVVSKLPAWRSILRGWRRPASRHDTVPFITHVFSIMRPPLLQVSWESRMVTNEATVVTLDKGSLLQPLTLPLQAGHGSIQHCIDSWHAQAHPHALTRAADYLLLHIARYEGDTVLNSHSLAFRPSLHFLCLAKVCDALEPLIALLGLSHIAVQGPARANTLLCCVLALEMPGIVAGWCEMADRPSTEISCRHKFTNTVMCWLLSGRASCNDGAGEVNDLR